VLGRLVRTAQVAHLPKIDSGGLRQWFENQLSDIWRRLQTAPPRVLTLEEQTLFAMRYYHQMAQRSKKASDSPAAEDPAAEA
jgi:CRISPR-associated protein Csd1